MKFLQGFLLQYLKTSQDCDEGLLQSDMEKAAEETVETDAVTDELDLVSLRWASTETFDPCLTLASLFHLHVVADTLVRGVELALVFNHLCCLPCFTAGV